MHPRACGGNECGPPTGKGRTGASPRLRGKLLTDPGATLGFGCIPAPAGETPGPSTTPSGPSVHPRACGGNLQSATSAYGTMGASPRLRGKPSALGGRIVLAGCIPAPAGETLSCTASTRGPSVHPRACGGNQWCERYDTDEDGASPRLRGKRRFGGRWMPGRRCIPAPAGETRSGRAAGADAGVHPRACGGNMFPMSSSNSSNGASPRLRGKLDRARLGHRGGRCIPAPAGETIGWSQRKHRSPVHPRACGGNRSEDRKRLPEMGASPRLRGKLRDQVGRRIQVWCIPAPAGETFDPPTTAATSRVHPRACGGNLRLLWFDIAFFGASPRLRGKRREPSPERTEKGCIPAPAGETVPRSRFSSRLQVHPRACGGNRCGLRPSGLRCGASPRLRGKPADRGGRRRYSGCIPAPAGETGRRRFACCSTAVHPRACGGNLPPRQLVR